MGLSVTPHYIYTIVIYPNGDYMLTCTDDATAAIHDDQCAAGEAQSAWDITDFHKYVRQVPGETLADAEEAVRDLRAAIGSEKA